MPLIHLCSSRRMKGFALITALVMLLVITVLALGGARLALDSKRISRNQRDNSIAFQAAEAALRDAERDIQSGVRTSLFSANSIQGFPASGCNAGPSNSASSLRGLCATVDESNPIWNTVSWKDGGTESQTVAYGDFTGQKFPIGTGVLPSQLPRYIIEVVQYKAPGATADSTPGAGNQSTFFYRITAVGWGPTGGAPVMLQSFYLKPDEPDPPPTP
ncbi:pilus assembly protein PilX [Ralstonia pickettii]|nr:pilus assembly protein PilX [Ralstonia pickettii]